ncbi:LacI family DNA-binding transcriptional regulator [Oceanobacillus jeddahense]|uniref:LacI family DNA-binding transcriptional regulator n=1 Tax=Oceanobacillus jeddahense TaxID=1462527 RepID=A0ABY5JTS7_9BACI|nr:LacI family DNA-binding transcriptional regulator [Oceanobacillus jeddahense]UUI02877.1 LacI family DNA-binding transcriptional regulator [Oceanobacillus jeddahense]
MKITRKVTIKDVSQHSGFGIGTVSRAINQSEGISEKTRKKIQASIEQLGYTPNYVAQSMRSQKYKSIAFFADISNPVFAQIAKSVQIELDSYGFTLSLCSIGEKNVEEKISSFLNGRSFDGIILSIPTEKDWKLNKVLTKIDIPVVPINRDVPTLPPGVLTDYYSSVKKAINYLISLGHESIAMITGNKEIRPTREGIRAYKDCFDFQGKQFNEELILSGKLNSKSGEELLLEIAPKIHRGEVTAVLSLNNQMFYGILRAMRKESLRYPDDISIITFEDNELTQLLDPPVTSIHRPIDDMGKQIAQVLLKYIQDPESYGEEEPIVIPTEFLIRDSCKPII